jgi:hypothetical protein
VQTLYHMPASIMNRHHHEYPQTPETIERAKRGALRELEEFAVNELDRLVKLHGAERIHELLAVVAIMNGDRVPCEMGQAS